MEIFKTKDIAGFFNLSDKVALKILKKYNTSHIEKYILSKYTMFYWNYQNIIEECFKELNLKNNIFIDFDDFTNFCVKKTNEFYKEQEELKIQNKIRQKENKIRQKENRIKAEIKRKERIELEKKTAIESAEISKIINDNLKNVWFKNTNTKYTIHVGETNSGKTYNALKSLLESENGVYLSPLRLLSFEIYDKIKSLGYQCDLITGEEKIIQVNSNFSSRTVEMMDYSKNFETLVLDECYMLGDKNRGKSWLKVILEANVKEIHIITSYDGLKIIKQLLKKTNKTFNVHEYKRLVPLEVKTHNYPYKKPLNKTVFITFSRIDALAEKANLENKGLNVSILYGNLPPEIKKEQMRKFISGENEICVSTDVIGMGLNLPCDHICFLKKQKFDGYSVRDLTATEVKQIGGRAGRFGYSEAGFVWGAKEMNFKFLEGKMKSSGDSVKITYCPIDIETVKKLPPTNLRDKLIYYNKLNFIPDELKDIVKLEKIDIYTTLALYSNYINQINIDDAWKLLTLPVKDNMFFWNKLVYNVYSKTKVKYEYPSLPDIKDIYSLKKVEDEVINIELLLYFSNVTRFKEFIDDDLVTKLKLYRENFIQQITAFLLNKRLSSNKYCVTCGKNVGIYWSHKECDSCHSNKRYDNWI